MEGHKIEQKFERSILGAQTARQNCTIGYYNLLYNLLEQAPKGGDFIRSELLHAFGSISARLSLISGIVQLCMMMLMEYQKYQLFPPNRVYFGPGKVLFSTYLCNGKSSVGPIPHVKHYV